MVAAWLTSTTEWLATLTRRRAADSLLICWIHGSQSCEVGPNVAWDSFCINHFYYLYQKISGVPERPGRITGITGGPWGTWSVQKHGSLSFLSAAFDPKEIVQGFQNYEGFMPIVRSAGWLGCAHSCGFKRLSWKSHPSPEHSPKVDIGGSG